MDILATLRAALRRPSALLLLGANAVPLVGAFAFGWDLAEILLLFWLESAVIGVFTVLKMLLVGRGLAAAFQVPFFVLHFGIFMTVHLVFLLALFVGPALLDRGLDGLLAFLANVGIGALALVVSHGGSFWLNFLRGPERGSATVDQLFFAPYPRVVAMHLTIILGAFLVLGLDEPRWALVILVAVKTVVDLGAHGWERARFAAKPVAAEDPDLAALERELR